MINATVIYHREDGVWWAEAPQAEGWSAAADTYSELHQLVREGLTFHFDTEEVRITELLEDGASITTGPTFGEVMKVKMDQVVAGFGFGAASPNRGFIAAGMQ